MGVKEILVTIIIGLVSAWLGAYLGYRYAFRMSELQNKQRLQSEIKAVIYELENQANKINTDEELKNLKEKYALTGEPLKTDALTHFISSGDYLELKNEDLAKKLVTLNQWYARMNMSGERYNNYIWGIGTVTTNKEKIMWDLGSAWISERGTLKQKIEEVIPLLKKFI